MNTLKIFLTLLVFYSIDSHSMCIGFEKGDPYFCAKFLIKEQIKVTDNFCNVKAKAIKHKMVGADKDKFEYYEKRLQDRDEFIIQLPSKYCSNKQIELSGFFKAYCFDIGTKEDLKNRPTLYFQEKSGIVEGFLFKSEFKCPRFD